MELITLKTSRELDCMRKAGRITAAARKLAGELVVPGVTTLEIDTAVRKFIESQGGKPSFLGYGGFTGSACISVNDVVIHGIPSKKIVARMGGRRVCESCGASYHIVNIPPKKDGVCDVCGGKLVQRKDDNPETVRDRLAVYHKETEPLKGFYEARGILKTVEDQPTVAGTTQAILEALGR